MGKNQHIVPYGSKWAVRTENSDRVGSVHRTQNAAINVGEKRAKAERSELIIHGRGGKIRDKDSYGNDPCPPKDKEH